MWVFIALAVLGLILKIVGPRDAEEGLAAATASVSQVFNLESKEPETGAAKSLTPDQGPIAGPIMTLDSLASAPSKTPVAREPGKPGEAPAKPAPSTDPR
jgi:hypothetical protein